MIVDRKNILHIIHSLEVGGAERLVVDFARQTDRDLFNVSICCLDGIGVLGEELKADGFSVISLGRKPGVDWNLIVRLRRFLKERKIDIIHAHQYSSFFYAALAKNFSKKPCIIFTEHGRFYPDRRRLKRVLFDPFLSGFASEIISIAEATKEAMARYDNFPREKIKVIYNGVVFKTGDVNRTTKRQELNIAPDDFVLATAARLDPIKNHDMLIRTMKRVSGIRPDCKLIIAGDGPEYDRLSGEIKKNGLTGVVRLLGQRDNVAGIFLASDLFLLSSLSEGHSVTLLEAMNAGLPAVVTNVGGNPEILKDGVTGFLVDSNDDKAMAEKILELYQNRSLAKRLGNAAKERARTLFSFERMMSQYKELYIKYAEQS